MTNMAKYIDAEKLKAEIDRIEEEARKVRVSGTDKEAIGADGKIKLCLKLKSLIDSLPQEQEELPKIAEYYYHKGVYEGLSQGRADALKILEESMKRKADPVIVIKQQEQQEVDLEKEIKDTCRGYWINDSHEQELGKQDIENIARHFYELGKNSK